MGPTASGKSTLALQLAEHSGAEIISVDSMCVYRGMDIGTAKPSAADQQRVRHHMLDVLDPSEECSVGWFQQRVQEIRDRHDPDVPLIFVGGTGLYHRAVFDGLELPGEFPEVEADLDRLPTEELHRRLAELDPTALTRIEPENRRRLLRALVVTVGAGRPFSSFGPGLDHYPQVPAVIVGLELDREDLTARIDQRLEQQLAEGFLDEVRGLDESVGTWSRTAAQALGYRELRAHLAGDTRFDEAVTLIRQRTRRFAVRQLRWFRRDPRVEWWHPETPALAERIHDNWTRASSVASG